MNFRDDMTHPDNDTLLRYALETVEAAERETLTTHIAGCPECSRALREITDDLALISGSLPDSSLPTADVPSIPVLRYVHVRAIFRAAAVVAVILLGGYLVIGPPGEVSVTVVPQRYTPPAVVIPSGEFAPCEAVDIAHL